MHPDTWVLPGGGVDHGEHPRDAVRREVYEETGLHVDPGDLVEVTSRHFTGARPDGLVEDFHGIAIVYDATVSDVSRGVEPHVTEVDGSTDRSAWVSLDEVAGLPLGHTAHTALTLLGLDLPALAPFTPSPSSGRSPS